MPEIRVAVIAGGIAGLATALDILAEAKRRGLDLHVTIMEKDDTCGGNLRTLHHEQQWQLEWGPNGFLDNEPATLRLIEGLGISDQLQRSSDVTRHRFLLVNGRLVEIPTSPGAFVTSPMLPLIAKLRMIGELFIPPRKDLGLAADKPETDETIYDFGCRRLGRDFAEVMLDPMVKGIFGGDARQLSLAAAFPRMVELEKNHGGLFRAMIALARGRKNKTDAGPSGVLHSFTGGMQTLITAAVDKLTADPRCTVSCGVAIDTVDQTGDMWTVRGEGCDPGPFAAVINAAPAHAAAPQLRKLAAPLADLLGAIPFAPMAVIALGFARQRIHHDLQGFGLLVPSREKRNLLGALWTSSIFSHRTPPRMALIRCMMGGAANPTVLDLDDEELVNLVLAELRPLLGIQGPYAMARVIRHQRAIAQYIVGHPARLKAIDQACQALPGLFLTGSSYKGIAVNSCCKEAEATALAVADYVQNMAPTSSSTAPKETC